MLTQNFPSSLGSDSQKIGPLRNASWKRGQPGELTTIQPTTLKKTTVETSAMSSERAPSRADPEPGPSSPGRRYRPDRLGEGPVGIHELAVADGQGWKTGRGRPDGELLGE